MEDVYTPHTPSPVTLWVVESKETNENNKKKMATVFTVTLFLKLLFTVMKAILLYLCVKPSVHLSLCLIHAKTSALPTRPGAQSCVLDCRTIRYKALYNL